MAALPTGEPSWRWRRLVIFPTVAVALYELHALNGAADTALSAHLATIWAMIGGGLVIAYSGFATVQDIASIWRTGSALPYAPPPGPDGGRP